MKTKQIMIRFLDSYPGTIIGSHNLQLEIPKFAQNIYGKYVNPETVSREWRKLREDKEFLKLNGYSIIEDMTAKGKEKKFIIRRINEVHRNSEGQAEQSGDNNPVGSAEGTSEARTGTV